MAHVAAERVEIVRARVDEIEPAEPDTDQHSQSEEQQCPGHPPALGPFGARPAQDTDERHAHDEHETVDMDGLQQADEQAGDECRAPVPQRAGSHSIHAAENTRICIVISVGCRRDATCGMSTPRQTTAPSAATG